MAAAALPLIGCQPSREPPPDRPGTVTFRELTATSPFYLGARGGARDWPEMTVYGFEQAAALPAVRAMELAVRSTADRVLVCCADPTTERVTGIDKVVAESTWAELSELKVHARATKDPGQPPQPLARLDDIIDRFIDRFVMFVEPVGAETASALMAKLISLQAPRRVVWKQPINSTRFGDASRHGFGTWGYVLDEPAHTGANLRRLARLDDIDLLGVSVSRNEKLIASVLDAARQNQKLAIAWNVQSRPESQDALQLGFAGISTTAIREAISWAP